MAHVVGGVLAGDVGLGLGCVVVGRWAVLWCGCFGALFFLWGVWLVVGGAVLGAHLSDIRLDSQ